MSKEIIEAYPVAGVAVHMAASLILKETENKQWEIKKDIVNNNETIGQIYGDEATNSLKTEWGTLLVYADGKQLANFKYKGALKEPPKPVVVEEKRHTHMPSYESGVIACRIHSESKGKLIENDMFDADASLHYLVTGLGDDFESDDFIEGFAWEMVHRDFEYNEMEAAEEYVLAQENAKQVLASILEEQ